MNGIDFLFVAIALVFLLIVWTIWDRYKDWSEWDRDRRHERKHHRYEFQDTLTERDYRLYLRKGRS